MKSLAVTGGIGSGKSFVTGILSKMGYPVFNTDGETKRLYCEDEVRAVLMKILGDKVFLSDGSVDRIRMASMVFSDSALLHKVENAVYPFLFEKLDGWLENKRKHGYELAVVESAVILEKELFKPLIDKVITVSAPESIRMDRVVERDGSDYERVSERMRVQHSDKWREQRSDYVIVNDGRALLPQISSALALLGMECTWAEPFDKSEKI
ncbi:MAG: dephospho-CoA kinase [Alistipes sp.]|nr:dephospho-CoA kinase [Candidatus Minthomonas equi]